MKLRLRGDSLRLRLTKLEVTTLRNQGWWQDASTLGPDGGPRLVYRVESADAEKPALSFTPGTETIVTVMLPSSDVVIWAESSKVGLYFDAPWGLKVAVEKDFHCLDPRRDEDESDNYHNPNADSSQHTECHTE